MVQRRRSLMVDRCVIFSSSSLLFVMVGLVWICFVCLFCFFLVLSVHFFGFRISCIEGCGENERFHRIALFILFYTFSTYVKMNSVILISIYYCYLFISIYHYYLYLNSFFSFSCILSLSFSISMLCVCVSIEVINKSKLWQAPEILSIPNQYKPICQNSDIYHRRPKNKSPIPFYRSPV